MGWWHAGLLEETERLAQERLDVQRQAEKDRSGLASRLRMLEATLEEKESREAELEQQRRAHTEDLQQHIHALEKQLKHHRQFIDVSGSAHAHTHTYTHKNNIATSLHRHQHTHSHINITFAHK